MKDGFIKVAGATPEIKVADCEFNKEKIALLIDKAEKKNVHLLVLPQLCMTSASCGDLFLQKSLTDSAMKWTVELVRQVPENMVAVFGSPFEIQGKLYNCAVAASAGKILCLVPLSAGLCQFEGVPERRQGLGRWFAQPLMTDCVAVYGGLEIPVSSRAVFSCVEQSSFSFEIATEPNLLSASSGASVVVLCSAAPSFAGKTRQLKKILEVRSFNRSCAFVYSGAGRGESTTDYVFSADNIICENGCCLASGKGREDELTVSEIDVSALSYIRKSKGSDLSAVQESRTYFDFHLNPEKTVLTRKYSRFPFISGQDDGFAADVLELQSRGLEKRLVHTKCKKVVTGISGGLDSTLALLVICRAFDRLGLPRKNIVCVTMPCFGTSSRTERNAVSLAENTGATLLKIDIRNSVSSHFRDIGQDEGIYDITFENAQARERTQVLMDLANKMNGFAVGTGDLSEIALGWSTFNGDHISNYNVNAGVPKTLVRYLVKSEAERERNSALGPVLLDILDTPVSPELIPGGKQETEAAVGPYELTDFFMYHILKNGCSPSKILRLALYTFGDGYSPETVVRCLNRFLTRFFSQQFKRNCSPDGPDVCLLSLSPRGAWSMPSDAAVVGWLTELTEEI